jgi:hypothetical protein
MKNRGGIVAGCVFSSSYCLVLELEVENQIFMIIGGRVSISFYHLLEGGSVGQIVKIGPVLFCSIGWPILLRD